MENLNPNTMYVAVHIGDNNVNLYEVFKPDACIGKCREDGKEATYIGKTDNNGSFREHEINIYNKFKERFVK